MTRQPKDPWPAILWTGIVLQSALLLACWIRGMG